MKKIQYVKLLGLLTILLFLNISCKDDDTLLRGSGITEQSWSTNQTYFASAEQTLTFTFTTLSSWTAQNSSTALLSLDNTAGNSGENINPEKPDVPINKNDAFQKVQKRRVQEKR